MFYIISLNVLKDFSYINKETPIQSEITGAVFRDYKAQKLTLRFDFRNINKKNIPIFCNKYTLL